MQPKEQYMVGGLIRDEPWDHSASWPRGPPQAELELLSVPMQLNVEIRYRQL